jgi:large subunit ribosomal protein L6
MSRVGKSPVVIPKDVSVQLVDGFITIKGKLGELKFAISENVNVSYKTADEAIENVSPDGFARVLVQPANDSKASRAMWGTVRNIINNMVKGVSEGFKVSLEINGVGFRAAADSKILTLTLGYSHEIKYAIPAGIKIECEKPTLVIISGSDKQLVGQVAGELMKYRPVEPYKGKGIFKAGTKVRRKEGKKK